MGTTTAKLLASILPMLAGLISGVWAGLGGIHPPSVKFFVIIFLSVFGTYGLVVLGVKLFTK